MSETINQKVREKINKLLAMANDASSPNEAGIAMAMAQKLMAEHSLTSMDLKLAELKIVRVSSMFSVTTPKDYESVLALAVANAFGCHHYWSGGRKGKSWTFGKWWFVGRPDQVAVAEHFMVVLQRAMVKGRAATVARFHGYEAKTKTAEGNGYCVGFAMAIYKKIIAENKPDKAASDALVNVGEKPVDHQKGKIGSAGLSAGYADGEKQGLFTPMNAGQKQERISA